MLGAVARFIKQATESFHENLAMICAERYWYQRGCESVTPEHMSLRARVCVCVSIYLLIYRYTVININNILNSFIKKAQQRL